MDSNMLSYAKELFSGNFVEEVAGKLSEKSEGVESAISAIIPTVFGGIAGKVSGEPSFLSTVVSEAKNIFTNHSLSDLPGLISADSTSSEATQAGSFLFDVFGGKLHGIVESIAGASGLKNDSVRKLLEAGQIGALGSIGKHLAEEGGSEGSVGTYLSDQKGAFLSAIPASLGIGSLLSGTQEVKQPAPHTAALHSDAHFHDVQQEDPATGNNRFFIPLILTVVILGLIIWLFRGCWGHEREDEQATAQVEDTSGAMAAAAGTLDTVTGNYIYNTGELTTITLPNGTTIENIGENSTESKLFKFLSDPNIKVDTVDKTTGWISFDRLYFKTSSSELTEDSKQQLKNISLILSAFPNATVKLGGYTDNSGNAQSNLELSAQRALVAQTQLIADGIDVNRVAAEGYGDQHPIASNETPEGRAQNRRIDLRVTAK